MGIFLVLIHTLITLWSENILSMISILYKFIAFFLLGVEGPKLWCILVNILYELKKKKVYFAIEWSALTSVSSIYYILSLSITEWGMLRSPTELCIQSYSFFFYFMLYEALLLDVYMVSIVIVSCWIDPFIIRTLGFPSSFFINFMWGLKKKNYHYLFTILRKKTLYE